MPRSTATLVSAAFVLVAVFLRPAGPAASLLASTPSTRQGGLAAVGPLSSSGDIHNHGCTASIVDSPHGNLVISAAHCLAGRHDLLFAPGYHDGLTPHGVWRSVGEPYVPSGWADHQDIDGEGSPYDFGFVVLGTQNGRSVQDVVGAALRLSTGAALPESVDVYGYPSTGHANYADTAYTCGNVGATANGASWESIECLGIPGGFSGGPWVVHGTYDLIGVIGGRGQDLPDIDPDNYSVRFGDDVRALYDTAANDPGGPGAP